MHLEPMADVSPSRLPRRITITVSHEVRDALLERSRREGRSLSNLAALLLEQATGRLS